MEWGRGVRVLRPPHGLSNAEILMMARRESAVILTADEDFIALPPGLEGVKRVVIRAFRKD
ncbi:MAG: DUF5615 family PIN-like protein [Candidatus Baldrarchaeia archaeon]